MRLIIIILKYVKISYIFVWVVSSADIMNTQYNFFDLISNFNQLISIS